jgi:hypothetical protein
VVFCAITINFLPSALQRVVYGIPVNQFVVSTPNPQLAFCAVALFWNDAPARINAATEHIILKGKDLKVFILIVFV